MRPAQRAWLDAFQDWEAAVRLYDYCRSPLSDRGPAAVAAAYRIAGDASVALDVAERAAVEERGVG